MIRNTLKALDHLHKTNALTISYRDQGVLDTVGIADLLTADTENGIKIGYSKAKNFYEVEDVRHTRKKGKHKNGRISQNF